MNEAVSRKELAGELERLRAKVAELESANRATRQQFEEGQTTSRESLADVREHLDLAVEGARLGTIDWDMTTGELIPNEQLAVMLGYTVEELRDVLIANDFPSAWGSIMHDEDRPRVKGILEAHFRGDVPCVEIECRFRAKDGRWKWLLCQGKVVRRDDSGAPLRTAGTLLDIHERKLTQDEFRRTHEELEARVAVRTAELAATNEALRKENAERRQIEAALRASEETARALLDVATESAILVELDSTIVLLNETAAQRLGGTVEELIGQKCFDLLPPELVASRRARGEEAYRARGSLRFQDERNGRFIDSNVCPVFDADGNVVRMAIFSRDITDMKTAEAKLRREQQLLHQLLDFHERERQLVAYEIHDGLAQELTGAIFRFQAFRELLKKDPEEAWKTFDVGMTLLGQGIKEARGLITGLRPPILDELGIIAAIEYLVCESSEHDGPEIEFLHDSRLERFAPSLQTAVFRIVQESLTNARRHSHSDRVLLELRRDALLLHIDVRDWGVGFDPDEIQNQRFGLESLRERARLLGGQTTIESRPGKGVHIHVTLPIVECSSETEE
ncbi:MAG: PAS domain S-box protein [Pirellulaceae bacterium]|nr:PAS domain S-box protein [Pirellulaceae bacterium]